MSFLKNHRPFTRGAAAPARPHGGLQDDHSGRPALQGPRGPPARCEGGSVPWGDGQGTLTPPPLPPPHTLGSCCLPAKGEHSHALVPARCPFHTAAVAVPPGPCLATGIWDDQGKVPLCRRAGPSAVGPARPPPFPDAAYEAMEGAALVPVTPWCHEHSPATIIANLGRVHSCDGHGSAGGFLLPASTQRAGGDSPGQAEQPRLPGHSRALAEKCRRFRGAPVALMAPPVLPSHGISHG